MDATSLLEQIQVTDMEDLKLYFVAKIKTHAAETPSFSVYEMRTEDSVRSSLYLAAISQLDELLSPKEFLDFENSIEAFDVVPFNDDFPDLSFKAVIHELRNSIPAMISSLAGISSREEVCAMCIEFFDNDTLEKVFVFSRVSPDKLIERTPDNAGKVKLDPVSAQLSLGKDEIVNLDAEIDCVFFRDNLLVFNKAHFEEMVEKYSNSVFLMSDELYDC